MIKYVMVWHFGFFFFEDSFKFHQMRHICNIGLDIDHSSLGKNLAQIDYLTDIIVHVHLTFE